MTIHPTLGLKGHVLLSGRVSIARVNATCTSGKTNAKRTITQAMSWLMTILGFHGVITTRPA